MLPGGQSQPRDERSELRRVHRQPRASHPTAQRRARLRRAIHPSPPSVRDDPRRARLPVQSAGAAVRVGVAETQALSRRARDRRAPRRERPKLVPPEQGAPRVRHAPRQPVATPPAHRPLPQRRVPRLREGKVRTPAGAHPRRVGRHGRPQTRRRLRRARRRRRATRRGPRDDGRRRRFGGTLAIGLAVRRPAREVRGVRRRRLRSRLGARRHRSAHWGAEAKVGRVSRLRRARASNLPRDEILPSRSRRRRRRGERPRTAETTRTTPRDVSVVRPRTLVGRGGGGGAATHGNRIERVGDGARARGARSRSASGAGAGAEPGPSSGARVSPDAEVARLARVDEATSSPRAESPVEWGMYDTEFELDDSDEGEKENDGGKTGDGKTGDGKTDRHAVRLSDSESDETRNVPLAERLTRRWRREAAADRRRDDPSPVAFDVIRISTSP